MTTINKIKLHNFKSFAKPTELVFGNNFNVVLGPNGSGKSNIMDALCFVLGKTSAKHMRAEKTANLIYNGGKDSKPAKEAYVSIFFDNSKKEFPIEDKTVKVTRIIKEAGNSVYKINDEKRTKQQILDLLSKVKIDPDGHNIILQGDIVRFMEMKPDERIELIKDISGISLYDDKKQKAMNELEKVDSRLNEAGIILTERDAHLREIQKEREQALKFKGLETKILDNKATFYYIQIKDKEKNKEELDKKINKQQTEIDKINKNIEDNKDEVKNTKEKIRNINREIEEKGETEQINLNQTIGNLKEEIIRENSRLDNYSNELKKIKLRKQQLNEDIKDIESRIANLIKDKAKQQENIKKLNNDLSKIQNKINSYKKKIGIGKLSSIEDVAKIQDSLIELQNDKQLLLREKDKLDIFLNNIKEGINKITSISKDKNFLLKKNKLNSINKELIKLETEDTSILNQLSKTRSEISNLHEGLNKVKAKEIIIKERVSNNQAVKRILSLKDKGIYGTISSLGKVDHKYSTALEVATGSRLDAIVVDNDLTASKCIKLLRENKLGTAIFLPLNKIKERVIDKNLKELAKKAHGLAIDLVDFNPKFKKAFSYALGNTLVVDNIEHARKIGIGRARMVSLQGDLLEVSGAMIGGYRKTAGYGFSEKDVDIKIKDLNTKLEKNKLLINRLEENKNNNEVKTLELRKERRTLESEILKTESSISDKDISLLNREKTDFNNKIAEINKKINNLDKEILLKNNEINSIKADRKNIKLSKGKIDISVIEALQEEEKTLREKIVAINSDTKNNEIQINNIHIPEQDKIKLIINQQDRENTQFLEEIKNINNKLRNLRSELKEKQTKEKKFYSNFKSLAEQRNKLNDLLQKKEEVIIRDEEKVRGVERKNNNISLGRAKIIAEIEGLNKGYEEFKEGKIRRNVNLNELKEEIRKFEKMLQQCGNVNLRALDIYEELKIEHGKLLEKVDKLRNEKEDVLKVMVEIEEKKRDIFMGIYESIEKNFTTIFSNLTKKAEAFLELENKEDPLSEGLDIKVRFSSNKFLDIRSLSGGEKTLAALAFIFAIQDYEPASFYFLDEVDAALDKTNSEMLSKLINKYSERAQYIMISHNDAVITEAQHIYGVSMQKDGTSNIVSLKI